MALADLFSERLEAGQSELTLLSLTDKEGIIPQENTNRRNNSNSDKSKYLRVAPGDIAYNTMRMWEGRSAYVGIEGLVSPAYTVCKPKSGANSSFFSYLFKSPKIIEQFRRYSQGLVKDTLNLKFEAFSRIVVPTPSPEEQQKIAECLSSIDVLITAETDKLAALRGHKKGLMQQLFPAEGETTPRLRFPEFLDARDWEEAPLAKFIEEFRDKSTVQDQFEVMTSARSGLVRQKEYYDNDRITERDNVGFNIIPPDYITYRSRSDDRKFYFNENDLKITGIVSIYYPVFRILNGSNKFFIELLSAFSRVVGKVSVGTSQTVLSLNQLGRVRLPIPGELEQRRIAAFLSSFDSLINAQSDKVDALKAHKFGLMQQLFPPSTGTTA